MRRRRHARASADRATGCAGAWGTTRTRSSGTSGRGPEPHSVEDLVALYERLDLVGVLLGWDAGGKELDNAEIARICRESGRFVGFGSVDPNREDALERLARFPELGLKGLKLHPTMQAFDPGDDRFLPFFDAAAELGLDPAHARGDERAGRRRAGRSGPAHRPRPADPARPHRRPAPAHADRARPRRLALAPRGRRDGAAQVQRLSRHLRLEVPLPARRGQARDPAAAAQPVLLRDRLPDVRPGGVPGRARPARAARGRRAAPSCATTPPRCWACDRRGRD